jgi:hypothetical protein
LSQIRQHGSTEKIVISSQWTQFLDIIIAAFKRDFPDMKYIVITGTTTREQRLRLISDFQKKESVRVCFMSSKAMSQGITLTAASRVYNMDIWWNGEMEYQTFSRLHRRGQTRPVVARTLIVQESIEKELRATCIVKKAVASAAVAERGVPKMLQMVQRMRLLFKLDDSGNILREMEKEKEEEEEARKKEQQGEATEANKDEAERSKKKKRIKRIASDEEELKTADDIAAALNNPSADEKLPDRDYLQSLQREMQLIRLRNDADGERKRGYDDDEEKAEEKEEAEDPTTEHHEWITIPDDDDDDDDDSTTTMTMTTTTSTTDSTTRPSVKRKRNRLLDFMENGDKWLTKKKKKTKHQGKKRKQRSRAIDVMMIDLAERLRRHQPDVPPAAPTLEPLFIDLIEDDVCAFEPPRPTHVQPPPAPSSPVQSRVDPNSSTSTSTSTTSRSSSTQRDGANPLRERMRMMMMRRGQR